MDTKNIKIPLLIIFLMTILFMIMTFYLYSSNFIRPELKLIINNGEMLFDDSEVYTPNSIITKTLTITNIGTKDVYYQIYLNNLTGDFKENVTFNIYLDDTLLYRNNALQFNIEHAFTSLKPIKITESHHYTIIVEINDIDNEFQNTKLTFDIIVVASTNRV